ncbi:hypothetical protein ABEF93_000989 [Exophiala dermatitidis]
MQPNRRVGKACARCRRRKAKCGACASAGVECTGYDASVGGAAPRSVLAELKSRIQQLESRLESLSSAHTASDPFGIGKALDELEYATAELDSRAGAMWFKSRSGASGACRDFSLCEELLLSSAPFLSIQASSCTTKNLDDIDPAENRGRPLTSVPEEVVRMLLKNYKDTYLAQYPFLDEDELDQSLLRVMSTTGSAGVSASHFDHFSLGMALAISATTLTRLDGQRATTLGREFWNGAKLHLPFILDGPGHEILRAMLLLAHYGFLHPHACDPFMCSGAAMSLALEMGLQHEVAADRDGLLSQKQRDDRRILFWSTYIMNWQVLPQVAHRDANRTGSNVHYIPARPFNLPVTEVSTQLPYISANGMLNSFLSHSSYVAPHVWSARMLELEALTMMYSPGSNQMSFQAFQDWQAGLISRLEAWHSATHSSVDDVLAKTIQFHDIIYHFLIFRLNRPSPGYPVPHLGMRQQSIRSALKVVHIYSINDKNGMLLYYWHAAYHMFELGVFLLYIMLEATQRHLPPSGFEVDDIEPGILLRTMGIILDILWKAVGRWPETEPSVRLLENVSCPVTEGFRQWTQGHSWHPGLLDTGIKAWLVDLNNIWSLPIRQAGTNN